MNKKCKILIVTDDIIAVMLNNKKGNTILTELFIKDKKAKYFFVFIIKSIYMNISLVKKYYLLINVKDRAS